MVTAAALPWMAARARLSRPRADALRLLCSRGFRFLHSSAQANQYEGQPNYVA